MKYVQCPHCAAFMTITGVTFVPATWVCQNDKCSKKFMVYEKIISIEETHVEKVIDNETP